MRERSYDEEPQYAWIVYAVGMLLVGGLAGYLLASTSPGPSTRSNAVQGAAAPLPAVVDEGGLKAYRDILARDPGNAQAAIGAGNLLYDGKRYGEAIPYYQQAFAITPGDIDVSTDLGTALWYSGRADDALAQYARSLRIDPTHGQTLYNVGVVRSEGKEDFEGAVAAWTTLLEKNPTYPNASGVRTMIAEARQKATAGLVAERTLR